MIFFVFQYKLYYLLLYIILYIKLDSIWSQITIYTSKYVPFKFICSLDLDQSDVRHNGAFLLDQSPHP
jgi:hypothetical protein